MGYLECSVIDVIVGTDGPVTGARIVYTGCKGLGSEDRTVGLCAGIDILT